MSTLTPEVPDTPVTEVADAKPHPEGKKRKRGYTHMKLSPAQRAEAIALVEADAETTESIAKRFGCPADTLKKFLAKRGVKRGSKAIDAEGVAKAAIEQALTIPADVIARRIYDTKNESYRLFEMIRKLVGREIIRTQQEGRPVGTAANDIKTLREAAQAVKVCREEAYALLGLDATKEPDDDMPDLTIQDLTDEEIAQMHDAPLLEGLDEVEIPPTHAPKETQERKDARKGAKSGAGDDFSDGELPRVLE